MNNTEKVKEEIIKIFENRLAIEPEKVKTQSFEMIGLENFDRIMLTVCLEDLFEVTLPDEEIDKSKDFEEVVSIVCKALDKEAEKLEQEKAL